MNHHHRTETMAGQRMAILMLCLLLISTFVPGTARAQAQEEEIAGEEKGLALTAWEMKATLEGGVAELTQTRSFYNPMQTVGAITLLYPMAEGTTALELQMVSPQGNYLITETEGFTDLKLVKEAGTEAFLHVMEANQSRAYIQTLVERYQEPAFLALDGKRLLVCQFPAPGESFLDLSIRSQQPIREEGGMKSFTLPLAGALAFEDVKGASVLDRVEGALELDIVSLYSLEGVYSPTHDISLQRDGLHRAQLDWKGSPVFGEELVLYYSELSTSFGAGLLDYRLTGKTIYQLVEDGYFMFLFSPNTAEFQERHISKDIVFVMDISGSMRGEKMVQAQAALAEILDILSPGDHFTLVCFSNQLSLFQDSLVGVSEENLSKAEDWILELEAGGGTDINGALLQGLNILAKNASAGRPREIVFLTDGLPSAGVVSQADILENVLNANTGIVDTTIHVLGIGYDVNTALLDRLAGDAGGETIYIEPEEDISSSLAEFYMTIAYPVLTNVSMEMEGITVLDQVPAALPDVYKGGELSVLGMYRLPENASGDITVYVNGTSSTGPVNFIHRFGTEEPGKHDYLPRIYATRAVGELLQEIRQEGENVELVGQVKSLGWRYGIETPYTSLRIEEDPVFDEEGFRELMGQGAVESSQLIHHYSQSRVAGLGLASNARLVGERTFLNLEGVHVESSLLPIKKTIELGGMAIEEWLALNLGVERLVKFGSPEYFQLATTEEIRDILALGTELVFRNGNEVLGITSGNLLLYLSQLKAQSLGEELVVSWVTSEPATTTLHYRPVTELGNGDWKIAENLSMTTRHQVTLTLPYGEYQFFVRSTDALKNTAVKNNQGQYYLVPHLDPGNPGSGSQPPARDGSDRLEITRASTTAAGVVIGGQNVRVRWETSLLSQGWVFVIDEEGTQTMVAETQTGLAHEISFDTPVVTDAEKLTLTIRIVARSSIPNATSPEDAVDSYEFMLEVIKVSYSVPSFGTGPVVVLFAALVCFVTATGAQAKQRRHRRPVGSVRETAGEVWPEGQDAASREAATEEVRPEGQDEVGQ